MAQIELKHLTFSYPDAEKSVLSDISLTVQSGEFLVLCGASGSGKSTLLRMLKTALAPHGSISGEIIFNGEKLADIAAERQTAEIGFVMQSPDNQIVTDKVWHELAFGLESLGSPTAEIRRRVAEMSAFFGISDWFHKDVSELSGGQKQLLCLASVMVMQPEILLLDEPTSQLDPIAADEFMQSLAKINKELGVTVILAEHRLEDAIPLADRIVLMDEGRILVQEDVRKFCESGRTNHYIMPFLPTPALIWASLDSPLTCPLNVAEGRTFLHTFMHENEVHPVPPKEYFDGAETVLSAKDVSFRYGKNLPLVVDGLNISLRKGELYSLLGGNGSGKSTTLRLICGLEKPIVGRIKTTAKISMLPQNPRGLFVKSSVREDLEDVCRFQKMDKSLAAARIAEIIQLCRLETLLDRHPFDLSGGEQQRLGLAKLLLTSPDVLLLDEPTKGMDSGFKAVFAQILKSLQSQGITILLVSHDVEFCAMHADRVGLFFDGNIICEDTPDKFFSRNRFYTTAAARMSQGLIPNAITAEDIISALGGRIQNIPDIPPFRPTGDILVKPSEKKISRQKNRLPKRTILACVMILLMIPLTLWYGVQSGSRHYNLISAAVLIECMAPFFLIFEGRKPKARELVLIAVLSALGVAGRAAFFMLPQFKPVLALVIISGAALGAESGFLVGAFTMLTSNILFSQGPWTPFQMFAMGIVGFLTGLLFRKNHPAKRKIPLCIFGAVSAIVIYGGIINPASLTWGNSVINLKSLLACYATGFPMDCIHAAATVLFLYLLAEPMTEKLNRVKSKYGLL